MRGDVGKAPVAAAAAAAAAVLLLGNPIPRKERSRSHPSLTTMPLFPARHKAAWSSDKVRGSLM